MRMRLIRLRLRNIASYRDDELIFTSLDYPILVTGPNGAGKTTFFVDGITFGLFKSAYGRGPLGSVPSTRLILSAGKKLSGEIELVFEIEGKTYMVRRRGSWVGDSVRWESNLYEVKDGGDLGRVAMQDEVDKKIRELTGYDHKTFLDSVVIRQGDVYSFVERNDSGRRDLLLRLINLELEKYRDEIRNRMNRLENEISMMMGNIESNKKLMEYSSLEEVEKAEKNIISLKKDLEEKLFELDSKISGFRREKEDVDKSLGGLINISNRIRGIEKRLKNLERSIADNGIKIISEDIDKVGELYVNLKEISGKIRFIDNEIASYTSILNKFEELNQLYDSLKKTEEEKFILMEKAYSKEIVLSSEFINSLHININTLNEKLSEIKESIELLNSSTEPNCPLCGRPLDEEHRKKVLTRLEGSLSILKAKLKEYNTVLNEAENLFKKYSKLEEDTRNLEIKIGLYTDELKNFDREKINNLVEDLRKEKNLSTKKFSSLLNMFCEIFSIHCDEESYEKLYNTFEEKREFFEEIKLLSSELNRLKSSFDDEKYNMLLKKSDDLFKEINLIESEKGRVHGDIEGMKIKLEEIGKQKKLIRETMSLENKLRKLNKKHMLWNYLLQYVFADSRFPRSLLKDIVEEFLTPETNKYLSIIYPSSSVQISVSEGGKGVSLSIYINNIRRDKSTLSGGEKTLIGFAIRLAIGSLVSSLSGGIKPDFLIIDEGFGPLDDENKNLIAEMLGTLISSKLFDQVIVITHESELKNHPVFRDIVSVRKVRDISHISIR